MKAIRIQAFGDPDVLYYEDVELCEPGPGEVRVRIEAIGVNFVDVYRRKGLYPSTLPLIPGAEAAGVVDALGAGVQDMTVGDRVAGAAVPAAYAEFAICPASALVPLPSNLDLRVAGAVLLQGLTAHFLTHSTYPLSANDNALVHAAAGGVGALLVQMAKRRGARVIGTVSTDEKAHVAREAGADEIIPYTRVDFSAEARRLTAGRGVDVVYDSVGQATFAGSLNALRPRGYLVLYGQSSGPLAPFDPQILNTKGSLYLTRPTLAHYIATRMELLQRAADLFTWIAAGALTVRVDTTFPLAEAAAAHRYLEERKTKGKVLLIP